MNLTKHWAVTLDDYAIDLAWSPNGTTLAAASATGSVLLLAAATGEKLHAFAGHENGTNVLAWMPMAQGLEPGNQSQLLATGGQDGSVKFWDTANGQHITTARLGHVWVEHLAWKLASKAQGAAPMAPNQLLFAVAGKNLTALRPDGSVAHTFPPAPKTIIALAVRPAGPEPIERSCGCVAAAHFGGVQLWGASDFVLKKELPYTNGIHALVWSPDSRWLVSGNQDPSVHLWIPEKNLELHMSGYEGKVKELSFDHTSRWLATGGGHDACIWDCAGNGPEGREPLMLPHDAKVCAVAFQHTHGLLATGSADGTVMLWSVDRRQPLRATVKMPAPATKLVWSPDDAILAIGAENGTVYTLRCVT